MWVDVPLDMLHLSIAMKSISDVLYSAGMMSVSTVLKPGLQPD